jgi:DNA gyrase subunit B
VTSPAATPPSSRSDYTAKSLSVLEGLEAVRKRPGMYIGSTDSKGLTHLAFEIVDNSVDEALAGHCGRIEVTLHADGSLEITDDGRGIPVDIEPKSGMTGVELVLTKLHAGGKFGGGGYKTSGGLHGVGASVVNALSVRLDAVVRRGGRVHTMSFCRGVPGVFSGEGPAASFTPRDGLSVAGKAPVKQTGTSIRWWPDLPLFTKGSAVDLDQLYARLRQTAFLVPGLTLAVLDRRGESMVEEVFRYDGGTVDFVEHLAPDRPVCDPVHLVGAGTYKETVPVLDDKGHMTTQTVERQCEVDVALRWGTGYDTTIQSFCNVVRTGHGGTHQNGFERAVLKALNEALVATRVHKAKDEPVVKDDVLEGLTAVVTVKVPEPQYLGQTKDELGTPGVSRIVADVVAKQLKAQFLEHRKHKAAARTVLEKVAAAAKTRQAAKASKDAARRKTALETSTLPAKLADCRSTDVGRTELWLVEGDSALGTGKLARNSEYQAMLPLRGKILNVQKATPSEMLNNAECAAIIQVVGAGTGRTFDLNAMRYNKIVLMSVHPDESVLVADRSGFLRLTSIGPYIDERLSVDDHVPEASTISYNEAGLGLRASAMKRVIRHNYSGQMLTLSTAYGRSVRVTSGHSVFAWRDGRSVLIPSDELAVGDLLVAPRRLPRPPATLEIDLLKLARAVAPDNYRVTGPGVTQLHQERVSAVPTNDVVDRASRRVRLGEGARRALVLARSTMAMTQAQLALSIGWAQPISVSTAERGLARVPEPIFRRWLDVLQLEWPVDAVLEPGFRGKHAPANGSANDRYRTLGAHAWVSSIPSSHDDVVGRDASVYVRAHLDSAFPRYRAVDEDLCEFLGWYLAEGTLSRGAVRLHLGQDDEPYIDRLRAIIDRLFAATCTVTPGTGRGVNLSFSSSEATLLVKGLGLGGNARTKRVPDLLLNVDESCQLAFLAGYFLGDGTKGQQDSRLAFTTSSRANADILGYLLGQLGVLASIGSRTGHAGLISDSEIMRGDYWSVTVSGKAQVRRLRRVWRNATNAPVIRSALATGNDQAPRALALSDDLVALPITRIDGAEYDGPVYDFSVADDESFVAGFGGGVCAHNTDADVDGAHIRCLLITLFARYMRPVIESGRLFAAVPPLHRIEVVGGKEPIYTYSDKQLQHELKKIEARGARVKGQIQRYKGLGEMDPDQLADTTMHPATRTLRRIRAGEADAAERALELLMGNDVAPRRDFIINNAARVDRDLLDT